MSNLPKSISEEVDQILKDCVNECADGIWGYYTDDYRNQILALIATETQKAVYGFHEYILEKNIIQQETDQVYNYARLHLALDKYINELTKKG